MVWLTFFFEEAAAQISPTVGYGMSLPQFTQQPQIACTGRLGILFAEAQLRGYVGYVNDVTATAGLLVGVAGSWNNNSLHELTTVLYGKYDKVLAAKPAWKEYPKSTMGIGVRHYVYNFFVDGLYQYGEVTVTLGWSFKSLYK